MYFFALSQAPPVFENEMAICTPDTIAPASKPETAPGPNKTPTTRGEPITRRPGMTIFLMEALVEMAMHLL
jgi:hypothetical protein